MGVTMAVTRRQQRLNQLLRDEIDKLLRHETDDPLLATMISVTDVETTQDLQKAARFFRREVAESINLRHTPELEFVYDPSIARGARVLALLRGMTIPPETPDETSDETSDMSDASATAAAKPAE
jgi:ribosome-binding factor A